MVRETDKPRNDQPGKAQDKRTDEEKREQLAEKVAQSTMFRAVESVKLKTAVQAEKQEQQKSQALKTMMQQLQQAYIRELPAGSQQSFIGTYLVTRDGVENSYDVSIGRNSYGGVYLMWYVSDALHELVLYGDGSLHFQSGGMDVTDGKHAVVVDSFMGLSALFAKQDDRQGATCHHLPPKQQASLIKKIHETLYGPTFGLDPLATIYQRLEGAPVFTDDPAQYDVSFREETCAQKGCAYTMSAQDYRKRFLTTPGDVGEREYEADNQHSSPHDMYMRDKQFRGQLNPHELGVMTRLRTSAGFTVLRSHMAILEKYFAAYKKSSIHTPIAEHYRHMTFSEFLERISATARWKVLFSDGRAYESWTDHSSVCLAVEEEGEASQMLASIGTDKDRNRRLYERHMTVEEASAVSFLPLAHGLCLPVASGARSGYARDSNWLESFHQTQRALQLTMYPVGPDIRSTYSVCLDKFALLVPDSTHSKEDIEKWQEGIKHARSCVGFMAVLPDLYGKDNALDLFSDDCSFVRRPIEAHMCDQYMHVNDEEGMPGYWLHKKAYKQRLSLMFEQVLCVADQQMAAHHLGEAFNLAGLGLGAFAFGNIDSNKAMAALYVEQLQQSLESGLADKLCHIKQINLINLPGDYKGDHEASALSVVAEYSSIVLKSGQLLKFQQHDDAGCVGAGVVAGDAFTTWWNEQNQHAPVPTAMVASSSSVAGATEANQLTWQMVAELASRRLSATSDESTCMSLLHGGQYLNTQYNQDMLQNIAELDPEQHQREVMSAGIAAKVSMRGTTFSKGDSGKGSGPGAGGAAAAPRS